MTVLAPRSDGYLGTPYVFVLWEDINVFGVTYHEIRGVSTCSHVICDSLDEVDKLPPLYNIRARLHIRVYANGSTRNGPNPNYGISYEEWRDHMDAINKRIGVQDADEDSAKQLTGPEPCSDG